MSTAPDGNAWRRVRSDLGAALLALLFFILPLYRAPYLENSFITPKIALCHAIVVLLVSLLAVRMWRGRVNSALGPVALLLGAFTAWNCVSILWSQSSALAIYASCYFI